MKLFCIGDLHLSGTPPTKPMDIFGTQWINHPTKIKANWLTTVNKEDTVLICGDISWAMDLNQAEDDLNWIAKLPGRKILLKGNHDYWWKSLKQIRQRFPDFEFLQNNCIMLGHTAICGTRGWKLPSYPDFTTNDQKHYKRELERLELSLKAAREHDAWEIIVVMHYPPLFRRWDNNGFTSLFKKYHVSTVLYGHIHGRPNMDRPQSLLNRICSRLVTVLPWLGFLFGTFGNKLPVWIFEGKKNGIKYKLCSADTQGFTPVLVKNFTI